MQENIYITYHDNIFVPILPKKERSCVNDKGTTLASSAPISLIYAVRARPLPLRWPPQCPDVPGRWPRR